MSNTLLNSMRKTASLGRTENGALTYTTTLNSVLDFFGMGGSLRQRGEQDIENLFVKAVNEDPLLAMKCLFHVRNCRGGAGERRTFRVILRYLANNYSDLVRKNLSNIVHYGRFDDLFVLVGTKLEKDAFTFAQATLDADWKAYQKGETISLAAKWAPSVNASSKATKALARKFCAFIGKTEKQYRQALSALRKYSNVLEVTISAKEWDGIDYSKLPSKAGLNYRKAFMKHDPIGYQKFIDRVKKGEAKINASTLFPYEIVEKVSSYWSASKDDDETIDILWDALPDYMEDKSRNMLVVADVSGSMSGRPMDTSISLAIYTAERNTGPFGGYFITYSERPTLQKVVGKTIREKVRNLQSTAAYSTNLQSAFTMVLDHAVKNRVSEDEMPRQIIVITDVEFNSAQNGQTNLDAIRTKYRNAGYEMPQLVFWNVNSRQNNCPAQANDKGVLLVSGSSPSVFKTLLSGISYTPVDQMLETLNSPMYDLVTA